MLKSYVTRIVLTLKYAIVTFLIIVLNINIALGQNIESNSLLGKPAPTFILKDKNNISYNLKEFSGKYIILLFFNKNLKKQAINYAESFIAKINALNFANTEIFMIADMRNIPFFITKDFVLKNSSKEETPIPLLFDWDQDVNKLYHEKLFAWYTA